MTNPDLDPELDIVVSKRPFQDVLAINELADLEAFEPRLRRRQPEEVEEDRPRFGWFRDEDGKKMKNGGEVGKTAVLDANVYATKKTIAQGLLDVALLTANASQLKYVLQAGREHEFYYVMVTLISLSIILQMCLGSVLILKGRCDINEQCQQRKADRLNNAVVCLVFASTVVHTFLSVFHIAPEQQKPIEYYRNRTRLATPES